MTPEVRVAALCDHALVGQDGKLSMLGIFRNITVSGLPAQHPRMYLVAVLGLESGSHEVVVRLVRPDGGAGMDTAPRLTVHAVSGQDVNVVVELNNTSFAAYGTYHFDVEVDGTKVAGLPVAITQMPATPPRKN